ncbi:MAG TPA: rhodanese-like domain-containing protein [Thermoanaerobaculia bacterium]
MRALNVRTSNRMLHLARLISIGLAVAVILLPLAGCTRIRHLFHRGPRAPFRRVTPAVAYEVQRDTPGILILDLRAPAEFQGDTGHVARARNIPLDELPYRLVEISGFREETLLVYCRDTPCGEAGMRVLVASGFEDAMLIDGGIDAWIRAGYRTVLTVQGTNPAPKAPAKPPG